MNANAAHAQMTLPVSATALIASLKEADQDHEFYPTSQEIIAAMTQDMRRLKDRTNLRFGSLLDIGAGNGKVLRALETKIGFDDLYAIEKSPILREQLDAAVLVVGTDFEQQSLLSKQVDVIYCNPPYSEFVPWTTKIVRESAAPLVYLLIPTRWKDATAITEAIAFRDGKTHIVGEFSFEKAEDRHARATVNLLRCQLSTEQDDAFERFFNEAFGGLKERYDAAECSYESGEKKDKTRWSDTDDDDEEEDGKGKPKKKKPTFEEKAAKTFSTLVVGETYPEAMVSLYDAEMAKIQRNYEQVSTLDADLMQELGVTPKKIMTCLKQRLSGLRNVYWKEIFERTAAITDRLTGKHREKLLKTLQEHVHVDFTVQNIFSTIIWVIKNANTHLDGQLIETYEQMVSKANVKNYKSNKKVFEFDRWRYRNGEGIKSTHYALDYRLVIEGLGGIQNDWGNVRGLRDSACAFLGDLLTVARNLGFDNKTSDRRVRESHYTNGWEPGRKEEFFCTNLRTGKHELLMDVRAHKAGTMHVRLNPSLTLALNVEYGRLKGWLKSGEQAADELDEPKAASCFHSNLALPTKGSLFPMLTAA